MPTQTITTDASQAQRLSVALGRKLNLRDANGAARDATAAEVKAYTIAHYRHIVHEYEAELARSQISDPAAFEPT